MADSLANLASSASYPCHMELIIMDHPSICNAAILTTDDQVGNSWISPNLDYLRNGTLSTDKSEAMKVRARVGRYTLITMFCTGDHFLVHTRGVFHLTMRNESLNKST